jgi:polysaccharide export outer membrane protein
MKTISLTILIACLLLSCSSSKNITYFEHSGNRSAFSDSSATSETKLKAGDLLIITVNSTSPEVAAPFNLPTVPLPTSSSSTSANPVATGTIALQNYLIDKDGTITFPVLGKINAAGMTKLQLSEYIKNKICPHYIKEMPIVNIRYTNYKISVLGEVNKPGVYTIDNEKINLLEAIALAGDLTIFGTRGNVLLIRDNDKGQRVTFGIDLRDRNIINSPLYYLHQNDILYIQPNKPKARSASFNTGESMTVSALGILISVASLVTLLVKK